MKYLKHVYPIKEQFNTWHWEVKGPFGKVVRWNAQVVLMNTNQNIVWLSDKNAEVGTSGVVRFHQLDNTHTEIEVDMSYASPGGNIGEAIAIIFKNPSRIVAENLHQFKILMELIRKRKEEVTGHPD